MPTRAKVTAVEQLKSRFDGAKTVVLTEYRGLTVQQLGELRRQLRAVPAQYRVVKNRLAKRAVAASPLETLTPHLTGPTGVVVSTEDPVAVAKALQTFARTNQVFTIKAGYVDGQLVRADGLRALAELPSKEGLRSRIVGTLQGPLAQLVGLLEAPQRELVYILQQRGKGAAE